MLSASSTLPHVTQGVSDPSSLSLPSYSDPLELELELVTGEVHVRKNVQAKSSEVGGAAKRLQCVRPGQGIQGRE